MDISNRNTIDLKDKRLTIIGLARSGIAAANLANSFGAKIFVSDSSNSDDVKQILSELETKGMNGETGGHTDKIYNADLWVISPGVPKDADIIHKGKEKHIPIVGEIEFASWFTMAPILAVTGSNGKTTTVNMLYEMCKTDDLDPSLSGNVGHPFSEIVLNDLDKVVPDRVHVLEVSSFQMEFIQHFKPFISIFLNLTPDHLNRYDNMDDYVSAKMNMWSNQDENDHLIFNADDELLAERISPSRARKTPFSLKSDSDILFKLNATKIYDKEHATLINLDDIALPGKHNLSNYLGAATAATLLGIASSRIKEVMSTFCGVPHRLENVGEVNGVTYINDSKATNIDSVKVALDSFSTPVWLILGGQNKGGDFLSLYPHTHTVKEVLTIGESEEAIATVLGDAVRLRSCGSLKSAVEVAHSHAQPGDIVLLSPGCASFDQFEDFEHRGDVFKELVSGLGAEA